MTYVLDANIVSYFIQENAQVILRLRAALMAGHSFVISPVTYYEIWAEADRNTHKICRLRVAQ